MLFKYTYLIIRKDLILFVIQIYNSFKKIQFYILISYMKKIDIYKKYILHIKIRSKKS